MSGCWLLHDNTEQEMYILRFPACRKTQRTLRHRKNLSFTRWCLLARSLFAMFIYTVLHSPRKIQHDITFIQRLQLRAYEHTITTYSTAQHSTRWLDGFYFFWVRVYWCMEQHHFPCRTVYVLAHDTYTRRICAREYLAVLLNRSTSPSTTTTTTTTIWEWQQQ